MDLGRSLAYIFEDDEWASKGAIGALLMMVPVLTFAGAGYEVRVARGVARGEPRPLPAWTDFDRLFLDGLWLALARLVYALPVFAMLCLPLAAVVLLATTAETERQMNQRLPAVLLVCGAFFLVVIFYSMLFGLFWPAVTALYVRRSTFAACFDFPSLARFIGDNLRPYLTAWAFSLGVSAAIFFAGRHGGRDDQPDPLLRTVGLLAAARRWIILMAPGQRPPGGSTPARRRGPLGRLAGPLPGR